MADGKRIKMLRLKKGITQVDLAAEVHITKQTLYKYENGIITNIPSDKIEELARVLNTTPAYLMGWDDDPNCQNKAEDEAVIYLSKAYNNSYEDHVKSKSIEETKDTESALLKEPAAPRPKGVKIPIMGSITADSPVGVAENIVDYEEIPADMAGIAAHFGLKIKDDSMLPEIQDGDTVIVRKQDDVESGEIAIILVSHHEATCKKVLKKEHTMILQPLNSNYDPMIYTEAEVTALPVQIIGKVVELRRKF